MQHLHIEQLMETSYAHLVGVMTIWFLAVVVPGPNFAAVLRTAATGRRDRTVWTVMGIGTGTLLWGLSVGFGVGTLLDRYPREFQALRVAGGLYMIFLGFKVIYKTFVPKHDEVANAERRSGSSAGAWLFGLLNILSNPKTPILMIGLFVLTEPRGYSIASRLASAALMSMVSIGWYGFVALVATTNAVRRRLHVRMIPLERLVGLVFMSFGVLSLLFV